ncbi:MAG: hypothetical protein ACOVQE_11360 [Chitinophagaceae bacterium]
MKRMQLLLMLIPFGVLAQLKSITSKKPSLIQSITSDVNNGKFNQVVFNYDENNRVIAIINKEIHKESDNIKKSKLIEEIIKEQIFQYSDNGLQPLSRKTTSYIPNSANSNKNKRFVVEYIEQQSFIYENGERIGDSSIYIKNWQQQLDWDWKTAEPQLRVGKLEKASERIYHEIDLTKPYSPPTKYINEFSLISLSNIGKDASSYRWANNANEATYYTFNAFDTFLNPLKQLNIAKTLVNEKISSEFGGQYGKTDINWYFFNQNNYTDYTVTTNEQSQHYKYIFQFRYTYNQFKQPVHAKVQVKQVYNKGGKLVRVYKQGFTFRYNK